MIENLAPGITRKRLLMEGLYTIAVNEKQIENYFNKISERLDVHMYSKPIIFSTGDSNASENSGYDAFVPLFDSGISCYIWTKMKFVSIIIYTCKDFDETTAIKETKRFFKLSEMVWNVF
jgi:S-adenosylmethionine decarboxylase